MQRCWSICAGNHYIKAILSAQQNTTSPQLTRSEFYRLAETCRTYALDLAQHDQSRVNLQECYKFNEWFAEVRAYAQLRPALQSVRLARPIARWQVLILVALLGWVLFLAFGGRMPRVLSTSLLMSHMFLLVLLYFVPQRLYGTTVEMLEGKVLRVVDALEALLMSGDLEFTEAAFFQAKENLQDARRELRQQIDLAHRRWR